MTQNLKHKVRKGYELILPLNKVNKALQGFIVIHNTNRGPALGGTRIFPYKNSNAALEDGLRLAKAMTYKCAISGLPFGGGKGVIIANPKAQNIKSILRLYAEAVNTLKGKFYTGEDVGLTEEHVQFMLKSSPYFIGKSHLAGDPSPFAARSAFFCGQVACKKAFGTSNLKNKTVAIKGIGKTGSALAELYVMHKAQVYVDDLDPLKVKLLIKKFPSIKIATQPVESMQVDIYAPCALGNDITKKNISTIKARIIAGTANNQLESPKIAEALFQKNILYVPDYISNSGGLINVAGELMPNGYSSKQVESIIQKVVKNFEKLLTTSFKEQADPLEISNFVAEQLFEKLPADKAKATNKHLIKV